MSIIVWCLFISHLLKLLLFYKVESINYFALQIIKRAFSVFRNLQCDRNTIHTNLVACLCLAEIIFLFGIVQYDKPVSPLCHHCFGIQIRNSCGEFYYDLAKTAFWNWYLRSVYVINRYSGCWFITNREQKYYSISLSTQSQAPIFGLWTATWFAQNRWKIFMGIG